MEMELEASQLSVAVRRELGRDITNVRGVKKRVRELQDLISGTKERLSEIENRGWWQRVWANNTRDLAVAMSDVVRIQQYSMALILTLIQANFGNLKVLKTVRNELGDVHESLGKAASSQEASGENQAMVAETLGNLLGIVDLHVEQAKETRRQIDAYRRPLIGTWVAIGALTIAVAGLYVRMLL